MKRTLPVLLLTLVSLKARPQRIDDYYRPPSSRQPTHHLLSRYGQAYTRERWYVGLEGFSRSDKNTLNQTFDGLISTRPTTQTGWSVMAGWVSQERWGLEAGYARSPIHNSLQIRNGSNPFNFHFENDKHGLVLRGKRVLRFTGRNTPDVAPTAKSGRRPGLWISAGLWLIPNSGRQISRLAFEGYQTRGRFSRTDTLYLTTDTQISSHLTGLAELSAEYTVPLGRRAEFSLFLRKNWGLSNSVTTNLAYTVNRGQPQLANLQGSGTGWSFGLSLRYIYGIRYDLKNRNGIYHSEE